MAAMTRTAQPSHWPAADGAQRPAGDDYGWADRKRGAQALQLGRRSLAGLREGVRFHDLRHTCASHLIQGSWGRRWALEEAGPHQLARALELAALLLREPAAAGRRAG